MRLADYFDNTVARQPDRTALIEGDLTVSFAEAQKIVHAIAHALDREPGIRKGSHVALYAPNHYLVPLLLLGINRADRVWLSAHTRNPVDVNITVLGYMDCDFIFFHSTYEHLVPELKAGLNTVVRFICIDRPSEYGTWLHDWMGDYLQQPYYSAMEEPNATCFMQPTGGTTGPSKAVVHTHGSAELQFHAAYNATRLTPNVRYLAVAPLTHAGGITALHTMLAGGSVVVINMADPVQIFDAIERWRVTNVFAPPTLLYTLLGHPRAKTTDFSSLRYFVVGAAPVAPEKFKEAFRVFGPVMCEGYAATECGMPLTFKLPEDYLLPDGSFDEAVLASAGRPTLPVRLEIMDGQGRLLPPGERGEIVVQSGMVMREYYKNPVETAAAGLFGWRHTGDIGIKDARGYVTIVDRLKDMIVSGGFNIYPAQIEALILEHDAVLDCAVVGVPDEKWGEAVKAIVQLKPGCSASEEALIAKCHEQLGGVYTPKSVEFWPELPRSAVGKVLRREIRAKFWEGQWRTVG